MLLLQKQGKFWGLVREFSSGNDIHTVFKEKTVFSKVFEGLVVN